ncbi:Tubulin alpha-8 chain [Echinococcus granulosus]|uniref:Tubulin alpha-8 chain n=1 Tax=Echinococcus granulosus TaxID=6210 RepID=W6U713_ECHGR|nr:Tubulin alpha-8 chain [Echinococcus granulosus]EUB56970.1 Tubulin alpha-8 chain [Echinococcus granulosus]
MREIIFLHIGQTGIQVGHAMWELACLEHNVGRDGTPVSLSQDDGLSIDSLFVHCSNGNYTPRALLIDLDPTVVDEVRVGHYRNLWNTSNLFGGREDAASNYARAYYSQSLCRLPGVLDRIRVLTEQCECLNSFKLVYSANGGTGSGLTAAILEELACNYGKKHRLATAIYPSPMFSQIVVEPYNATLHTSSTIDFCDCVTLADNQAIHRILGIHSGPNSAGYTVTNRLLARLINALCLSHRYNFMGQQKVDIGELLTNLVPYPRIHFPTMAYAPFFNQMAASFETPTVTQMLERIYDQDNQLSSICIRNQPFIACALLFRGNISPFEVNDALKTIKCNKKAEFVDWCPTGFKTGINFTPPIEVPCEGFPGLDTICINMISHNVGIREAWIRTADHFSKLYCKRAFIHWFVSEGLEESEFLESQETLASIINDYEEIGKSLKDICGSEQMQQSNVWMDEKKPKFAPGGDGSSFKRPPRSRFAFKTRGMQKVESRRLANIEISPISSTISSITPAPSSVAECNPREGRRNKNTNCLSDPSLTLRPVPRPRRSRLRTLSGSHREEEKSTFCSVFIEDLGRGDTTVETMEECQSQEVDYRDSLISQFENSLSTVTVDWDD